MNFDQIPKWQRELMSFVNVKNTFLLEGNVKDIYPVFKERENGEYDTKNFINLNSYINKFLNNNGPNYDIIYYDTVIGFNNPFTNEKIKEILDRYRDKESFIEKKGLNANERHFDCELLAASKIIKNAIVDNQQSLEVEKRKPITFVLNYASRYMVTPGNLDQLARNVFMNLFYAAVNGNEILLENNVRKKNLIFIIIDKINDLPAWFYLDNPNDKVLTITNPDKLVREAYINLSMPELCVKEPKVMEMKKHFIDATDGLKLDEIRKIKILASSLASSSQSKKYTDAVFLYKYGVKTNPWDTLDLNELSNADVKIAKRVKGQEVAVSKVLDVIKRAATGFSGLQHSSVGAKPKGILFFAGPTGTGKTEMAKTISELLFGDEANCIRFDMSEYQQPQSDQKLLGAPPGYVGYEAGGQLTNSVKEKPFSILLFDEIEKAHPSILDKFLQILDDGRMTDGQGNTVYFSETIIIFTSNLGIYRTEMINGQEKKIQVVSSSDKYEDINKRVLQEVKDYFINKLGRPEILNRIGNNIIVFDFIREGACGAIVGKQLSNIKKNILDTKKIEIDTTDIEEYLINKAKTNLDYGGRGIGNIVEEYFINPLSRFCFDNSVKANHKVIIREILERDGIIEMNCDIVDITQGA